jgi:endonuclease/exonuclease/phosphatase family metal-dependent hydrolase
MGDLNAHPDDPALQPLHDAGLRDMWASAHPDESGGTYPAEAPRERIDYLFAGAGWQVASIERIGMGTDAFSDHCGLLARLTRAD